MPLVEGPGPIRSICLLYGAIALGLAACTASTDAETGFDSGASGVWAVTHARQKVFVINYDPVLGNGRPLTADKHWNPSRRLAESYATALYFASGRGVAYDIIGWHDINAFPPQIGPSFSETSYEACLAEGESCYGTKHADYQKMIQEFDLCRAAAEHNVDEVWWFGGPGFGFAESRMVGNGAFYVNSEPLELPDTLFHQWGCERPFIIMGFNYERTEGEMLHNFGHRVDSVLRHHIDLVTPGFDIVAARRFMTPWQNSVAGCGDTHHPPNLKSTDPEYLYDLNRDVYSDCESIGPVPDPARPLSQVNCFSWGCSETGYHTWRFDKLPRVAASNWWQHILVNATWAEGSASIRPPM
ncbi:MAG: hypothetical protein H6714_03360 [Myxococcales bacterium]|nr:hypothetical protein [Myxococcales bacterium]